MSFSSSVMDRTVLFEAPASLGVREQEEPASCLVLGSVGGRRIERKAYGGKCKGGVNTISQTFMFMEEGEGVTGTGCCSGDGLTWKLDSSRGTRCATHRPEKSRFPLLQKSNI